VSRSRRPFRPIGRLAVVVAAACLTAGLTACEAGNDAPTLTQYHPSNYGVNTVAHGIKINNGFVLGAPVGSTLAAGQNAGLFLALYNLGRADRLVSATAPGTAASVQLPPGGIPLPNQQGVYLTGPEPTIVLTNLTHPLPGGGAIPVVLHFVNAGNIRLTLPVIPRSDYYATFAPAPSPSPTPSATSTKHGQGTGGPGATSTSSPGASGKPSPSAS
jgi:copper(I)-binding protein